MPSNLYVHFPFCRRKCSYCALYSRAGASEAIRHNYVEHLTAAVRALPQGRFETVYFGGGTPAFCDLTPILKALEPRLGATAEFTVELHPLDVTEEAVARLFDAGVNRLSMGLQSLDNRTLQVMGRGYTLDDAARAFETVKRFVENAGVDLIVGYPGDSVLDLTRLASWGLRHVSVYSLQNERNLADVPNDDVVLDCIRSATETLNRIGLHRYEISNYASPGFECRHNCAVWRGEDYLGLGEGACGRIGLRRTRHMGTPKESEETLDVASDRRERTIFRLRLLDEGLSAAGFVDKSDVLQMFCEKGLLVLKNAISPRYCLTARGTEVCDSILSELI